MKPMTDSSKNHIFLAKVERALTRALDEAVTQTVRGRKLEAALSEVSRTREALAEKLAEKLAER